MPYRSEAQRRFFHTATARREGISAATTAEFDAASKGKQLPERAGGNMKGVKGYLHRVAAKRAAFAGTESPREERAEMSKTKRRGVKVRPANKGKKAAY